MCTGRYTTTYMNRDVIAIAVGCVLAIVAGGWLFLSATSKGPSVAQPEAVPFAVIDKGYTSGDITSRKNYRIHTPAELQELWRMVYGVDAPSAPPVDFTEDEVIAVFDGTHSSGGFGISIVEVRDSGLTRVVRIRHSEPGEGCITTQAIASPFEIVILPKSNSSIAREDVIETVCCQ